VIPRHPDLVCRSLGTLRSVFIGVNTTYEDSTGNHPKHRTQHSQHSESLKSRNENMFIIKENLDSKIQNPGITEFYVTVDITYPKVST
jgi:hypothetical protein